MPKKPVKKATKTDSIPRVRKLIDSTDKPAELFSIIADTNEAIKASNDAKINYRTMSKDKDVDKADLRAAKKAMDASIKKEETSREKVDTSAKQIQVQGYVSEHLDTLARILFEKPQEMWKPSVLRSFKSLHNPTTSTAYSPLNTVILSNFMSQHELSNPRFITKSRAKKMFGAEVTQDENGKERPSAYVVALKKDLLLNVFEKNKDGTMKKDANGHPIKKLDSNGDPIIYSRKAYGFAPPLINVEHLRSHPDIPKTWLTVNNTPAIGEPDNEFVRKLIDFVAKDVSPVKVVIDPNTDHSYCTTSKVVLADNYRSPLVEFSSLSHEVMHTSGYYNLTTGVYKTRDERRESLLDYHKSQASRGIEELTVQIAMMQFTDSLKLSSLDKDLYDATMSNHDVYNQGWASAIHKGDKSEEAFEKFKETLPVVLTESAKALRDFVDRAVLKMELNPELHAEIKNNLGEDNIISLKIKANELSVEADALKNERQAAFRAQKMKI